MNIMDPWTTPEPGFEKYQGPKADGFEPLDRRGVDLRAFLRSTEVQEAIGQSSEGESEGPSGAVMLPNGASAQLTQTATGEWELMLHAGRDYYRIFTARTRDEVLRLGLAELRRTAP